MADKYYYGKGKRKTAIAKVRLHINGSGEIIINGKPMKDYVSVNDLHSTVTAPLTITNTKGKFNISVLVTGGGVTGQAEAIRHGISKALIEFNPDLKPTLKKEGFLTRDSRKKERKKPGLARARRAKQFSKR